MTDLGLVLQRVAQQAADDRHRQWMGEVGYHIEPALLLDLVEQRVDQGGDVGLQGLDYLGANALLTSLRSRV